MKSLILIFLVTSYLQACKDIDRRNFRSVKDNPKPAEQAPKDVNQNGNDNKDSNENQDSNNEGNQSDDTQNQDSNNQEQPPAEPPPQPKDITRAFTKAGKSKGIENPVMWDHGKSHGLAVSYNSSPKTSDYADIWLAKVLSAALEELKARFKVAKVSHMGIYNYRKIAGSNNLSRHSYALAFDIGSFTLEDGTVLSVLKDWKNATKGPILHQIRDTLCSSFHVVLSPDYNAAHKNHFHIDLDPARRAAEEKAPFWNDLPNFRFGVLSSELLSSDEDSFSLTEEEAANVSEAFLNEGDEGLSLRNGFIANTCK